MAALRDRLGITAELERGSGGIFEVSVDGVVVARKGLYGFPSEDEIVTAVSKATGGEKRP